MKSLIQYITEKLIINKNFDDGKLHPKNADELGAIILERMGPNWDKDLDLSDVDISNIDDFTGLFTAYEGKIINLSGWDTSHVKCMHQMFLSCKNLKDIIGIENFNFDSCENVTYMFAYCNKLRIGKKIRNWQMDKRKISYSCILMGCPSAVPLSLR